ncbi:MAG: DUF1150 family protein [Pseudomonadota bacterium]
MENHDDNVGELRGPGVTKDALARIGAQSTAYIRIMSPEKIEKTFPDVAKDMPGISLFAVYRGDGTPIALADSREAALENLAENDLRPMTVH